MYLCVFACCRTLNEVVSGVVTKCLSATKQKTKEKGSEIVMLYIELDKPDLVQVLLCILLVSVCSLPYMQIRISRNK